MTPKERKSSSTGSLQQKLQNEAADVEIADEKEDQETRLLDHPSYITLQNQLTEAEDKKLEAEQKASEYWDRLLRAQAEALNSQKRFELDIANAHKYGLKNFVLELLPVIDNLERAIASHMSDESGAGSLLDGVQLTLKMFDAALNKFGVEAVNPLEEAFNPELHQAVSVKPATKKSGTVLEVLQKGYLLNKRLIRPALVIVAE